jgi:hypothetical protein
VSVSAQPVARPCIEGLAPMPDSPLNPIVILRNLDLGLALLLRPCQCRTRDPEMTGCGSPFEFNTMTTRPFRMTTGMINVRMPDPGHDAAINLIHRHGNPGRPRDRHWHATMSAIVEPVFMFALNLLRDALPPWAGQMGWLPMPTATHRQCHDGAIDFGYVTVDESVPEQ